MLQLFTITPYALLQKKVISDYAVLQQFCWVFNTFCPILMVYIYYVKMYTGHWVGIFKAARASCQTYGLRKIWYPAPTGWVKTNAMAESWRTVKWLRSSRLTSVNQARRDQKQSLYFILRHQLQQQLDNRLVFSFILKLARKSLLQKSDFPCAIAFTLFLALSFSL